MKKFMGILTVVLFASGYVVSSEPVAQKKQNVGAKKTVTVAAATTSTASVAEIEKKAKVEKDWGFGIGSCLEGGNYLNRGKSVTNFHIIPSVSYNVPKIGITVGTSLYISSSLNRTSNDQRRTDLASTEIFAAYPIWKNKSGTSLSALGLYNMGMLSTEKGAWDAGESTLFGRLDLKQMLGKVLLRMRPSLLYEVNPGYVAGDLNYRSEVELAGFYEFNKYFTAYYKQKYRRYVKGVTGSSGDNNWLVYSIPGISLSYKNWGLDTYLYASATTQGNAWTRETLNSSTTYVELNRSF